MLSRKEKIKTSLEFTTQVVPIPPNPTDFHKNNHQKHHKSTVSPILFILHSHTYINSNINSIFRTLISTESQGKTQEALENCSEKL